MTQAEEARRARYKRAWELRYVQHLKWREVGAALGVGDERARQLAAAHMGWRRYEDWMEHMKRERVSDGPAT